MTPGARLQATIEMLEQLLLSWETPQRIPADKQLERHFKAHRYIGSKDRGGVAELFYWILRHKASLEWWIETVLPTSEKKEGVARRNDMYARARQLTFAALMLRGDADPTSMQSLFKDSKYSPEPLSPTEAELCSALSGKQLEQRDMPFPVRFNYPAWMHEPLNESFGMTLSTAMRMLNQQAPTDLRANTLKTTRDALVDHLQQEGFDAKPTPHSAAGLRLTKRAPVFTSRYFKQGHFEMQDEGSQLVAQLVDARPGYKVIDFCAGAGGKTLAIAASMQNKGRILAWDTSEKRLSQIALRLKRAGVSNVQVHAITSEHDAFIKRHKASADRVLVDVPCSGSGTWRRNPDLKWRFNEQDLQEVLAVQQRILRSAARLVKPGGWLIYATCSILQSENEHQITDFLTSGNNFRVVCARKIWDKTTSDDTDAVSYLSVTPHQDGVDGFFAAVLERLPEDTTKKPDNVQEAS